tara:strand:- start:1 stop:366 length:366 start_codon:yes stop_codon:yes gene_type:complete
MEIPMREAKKLEDGKHTGKIIDVKYKTDPYEYTHVVIKVDNEDDFTIEYSCPTVLTANSKLMKLLANFGVVFEADKNIDPSKVLDGQLVEFMTLSQPSKKDPSVSYSNVVDGSIKPKAEQQ